MASNIPAFECYAPKPCCDQHGILLIGKNLSGVLPHEDWDHTIHWARLLVESVAVYFPKSYSGNVQKKVERVFLNKIESSTLFKAHLIAAISHTFLNVPIAHRPHLCTLIRAHFTWAQKHNNQFDQDLKTALGTVWQPLLKQLPSKKS